MPTYKEYKTGKTKYYSAFSGSSGTIAKGGGGVSVGVGYGQQSVQLASPASTKEGIAEQAASVVAAQKKLEAQQKAGLVSKEARVTDILSPKGGTVERYPFGVIEKYRQQLGAYNVGIGRRREPGTEIDATQAVRLIRSSGWQNAGNEILATGGQTYKTEMALTPPEFLGYSRAEPGQITDYFREDRYSQGKSEFKPNVFLNQVGFYNVMEKAKAAIDKTMTEIRGRSANTVTLKAIKASQLGIYHYGKGSVEGIEEHPYIAAATLPIAFFFRPGLNILGVVGGKLGINKVMGVISKAGKFIPPKLITLGKYSPEILYGGYTAGRVALTQGDISKKIERMGAIHATEIAPAIAGSKLYEAITLPRYLSGSVSAVESVKTYKTTAAGVESAEVAAVQGRIEMKNLIGQRTYVDVQGIARESAVPGMLQLSKRGVWRLEGMQDYTAEIVKLQKTMPRIKGLTKDVSFKGMQVDVHKELIGIARELRGGKLGAVRFGSQLSKVAGAKTGQGALDVQSSLSAKLKKLVRSIGMGGTIKTYKDVAELPKFKRAMLNAALKNKAYFGSRYKDVLRTNIVESPELRIDRTVSKGMAYALAQNKFRSEMVDFNYRKYRLPSARNFARMMSSKTGQFSIGGQKALLQESGLGLSAERGMKQAAEYAVSSAVPKGLRAMPSIRLRSAERFLQLRTPTTSLRSTVRNEVAYALRNPVIQALRVPQIEKLKSPTIQKLRQPTITSLRTGQFQSLKTPQILRQTTITQLRTGGGFTPPVPPPPPPPPFVLPRVLFNRELKQGKRYRQGGAGFKEVYTPSVEAILRNIRGKVSQAGIKGIGLRPIPTR